MTKTASAFVLCARIAGTLAIGALQASGPASGRVPPIPQAAEVAPPERWRAASAGATPIDTQWWQVFGDPVLTALVEKALTRNTDIGLAAERVEEARALARLASAQRLPLATGAFPGGDARAIVPGIGGSDAFYGTPQLTVSYDLDIFGRLKQASRAARASLLATTAARNAVALGVASTTASAYITLLGLDARLAIARSTLESRAGALHLAQRRTQAGYSSQLELSQALAEYQSTEQLVPAAELAVTRQENALSILVGDVPGAIVRGKSLATLATPAIPAGLPSDVLRRRPDLEQAEDTLVASDHSLRSARAAMLPSIGLTGSGGVAISTAFLAPITIWSAAASLTSPLFDGGRLRAQSNAARARRDQAAFAYRRAALTALREVEDGLVAVHRLEEQRVALADQVNTLEQTLRLATNRYREGYAPYLDELDAQRGLLTAQLTLAQTDADRLTSYVTLYQAMGGGWPIYVPAT